MKDIAHFNGLVWLGVKIDIKKAQKSGSKKQRFQKGILLEPTGRVKSYVCFLDFEDWGQDYCLMLQYGLMKMGTLPTNSVFDLILYNSYVK